MRLLFFLYVTLNMLYLTSGFSTSTRQQFSIANSLGKSVVIMATHQRTKFSEEKIIKKTHKFYHNKSANFIVLPVASSFNIQDRATDQSIMYWDECLTQAQCEAIISKFESSEEEQYSGSVFVDGVHKEVLAQNYLRYFTSTKQELLINLIYFKTSA